MTQAAHADGVDAVAVGQGGSDDSDPLATLKPGTIIEGKHRIERILGRGGMGVVAAATHLHLEEKVALKFLQVKDGDVGGDFRARFALEARVCARLRNEHIARVHDVGIWQDKTPFMVMEYLEGVDLRRLLKDGIKLPLAQAVEYTVQVCEGLAEAHAQGIVHRDLKPPNLFITRRQDGSELVKVLDFGISKWTSAEEDVGELTKTGVMLGSPKYMSPEQLNGDAIDSRADVWSIGAILYQMLTGRPPYDFPQVTQTFMAIASGQLPPRPTSLEPSIPVALEAVILRCLTREKDKRVQNVADLAGAILEAVESPFASHVQARLQGVLEPASLSNRSGPLSMTTGSHTVFSVTSPGTSSLPGVLLSQVPSSRPLSAGKARFGLKQWGMAAAGVAALAAVLVTRSPMAGVAYGADSSRSKTVALKHLAAEGSTSLASVPLSIPVAALPPVRVAAHEIARAAVRAAPRAQTAASPAAAAPSASPAPAVAVATPPSRSAASALDDRQ